MTTTAGNVARTLIADIEKEPRKSATIITYLKPMSAINAGMYDIGKNKKLKTSEIKPKSIRYGIIHNIKMLATGAMIENLPNW